MLPIIMIPPSHVASFGVRSAELCVTIFRQQFLQPSLKTLPRFHQKLHWVNGGALPKICTRCFYFYSFSQTYLVARFPFVACLVFYSLLLLQPVKIHINIDVYMGRRGLINCPNGMDWTTPLSSCLGYKRWFHISWSHANQVTWITPINLHNFGYVPFLRHRGFKHEVRNTFLFQRNGDPFNDPHIPTSSSYLHFANIHLKRRRCILYFVTTCFLPFSAEWVTSICWWAYHITALLNDILFVASRTPIHTKKKHVNCMTAAR